MVMLPLADLSAVPDREAEDVTTELMLFDRAVATVREDISSISEQFAESLPAEELALFEHQDINLNQ